MYTTPGIAINAGERCPKFHSDIVVLKYEIKRLPVFIPRLIYVEKHAGKLPSTCTRTVEPALMIEWWIKHMLFAITFSLTHKIRRSPKTGKTLLKGFLEATP